MSEPSQIKDTAEAVKGIAEAIPVYNDLLQPAVRELGGALATVAKAVRIALAPVSAMVWGYEQIAEYVTRRVSEHLRNVPDAAITTPPPNIAGPTLEALRFTAAIPELREMYARLLATAMDGQSSVRAHPAFIEVIRQLSPDEARLLMSIGTDTFPGVEVIGKHMNGDVQTAVSHLVKHYILLPDGLSSTSPATAEEYLDNLLRLGLVEVVHNMPLAECDYAPIKESAGMSPLVQRFKERFPSAIIEFREQVVYLTKFGKQFSKACVPSSLEKQATELPVEKNGRGG
jgi:hypothetical protein